jgi:uncharacterized protein YfbU (UPF0304 family)
MASITIRMSDETRDELDDLAQTVGESVSELLRTQIHSLLGKDVQMEHRDDVPTALSQQQRLILAQQHEILGLLQAGDENEVEHHQQMVEVLRRGYAGEYDNVFIGISPEMSRKDCSLLWDILDMFSGLEASVSRLEDHEREALGKGWLKVLRFGGFDRNDAMEGRLLSYFRHLLRTGRWAHLEEQLDAVGSNGNSHHRNLPIYQRMLEVYKDYTEGQQAGRLYARVLGLEQLRRVAEASIHPENRGRATRP